MDEKKNNIKTTILTIIIIIETIVLLISLAYSTFLFTYTDAETEWFKETSPDGQFVVSCYKIGTPLFFSPQDLKICFHEAKSVKVEDINDVWFETDIANDGQTLYDVNYSIEWLEDSVKIMLIGDESKSVFVIPYYRDLEDEITKLEEYKYNRMNYRNK